MARVTYNRVAETKVRAESTARVEVAGMGEDGAVVCKLPIVNCAVNLSLLHHPRVTLDGGSPVLEFLAHLLPSPRSLHSGPA